MKFVYPARFKFEDGSYWVSFPDLDGCFSHGDTAEEAIVHAQEALALYLEPDNENPQFPQATPINEIECEDNSSFVSLVVADVSIDMGKQSEKLYNSGVVE